MAKIRSGKGEPQAPRDAAARLSVMASLSRARLSGRFGFAVLVRLARRAPPDALALELGEKLTLLAVVLRR